METMHAKMDGFSTAMKNQLSFNEALETQLAQLAAATPVAELGKILGQPESTLESVNVINAMWKEPLAGHPSAMQRSSHAQEEARGASWQPQ